MVTIILQCPHCGSKAVIPEEQHTAVGKETGETAHVEWWKNTLR